jgi:hypothetical protein
MLKKMFESQNFFLPHLRFKVMNKLVESIAENLPPDLDSMRQSIETVVTVINVQKNVSQDAQVRSVQYL